MSELDAQGRAARKVRELRALATRFATDVEQIHAADQELRTLLPHLTPAAAEEINRTLDRVSSDMAAVMIRLLGGEAS